MCHVLELYFWLGMSRLEKIGGVWGLDKILSKAGFGTEIGWRLVAELTKGFNH
jgi:hypothetical protein